MNAALKTMLNKMFRRNIIGAKHTPENLIIGSKLKHVNNYSKKEFYEEYHKLLRQNYFIRLKKRTGKGSDWHISLNPEMIEEIKELVEEKDEIL